MLLEVEKLTKAFGGLVAVDNVDFQVKEHEIMGIIGPNGAGKSTVINQICGFYPPTSGKITFKGQDITGWKAHKVASLGIGRNFQATVLFMNESCLSNVWSAYHTAYKSNIASRILHLPSANSEANEFKKRGAEILDWMGMGQLKDELAVNLPHGYARLLGICIGMALNPSLLILDEPLTGMNAVEKETTLGLLRKIRDSGITLCMIEHDMKSVMSICERLVVLDHGVKIAEGTPEEIQKNEMVIEAYLGRKK
jgi:branched-chain amino acid transport system ATP-binding protein